LWTAACDTSYTNGGQGPAPLPLVLTHGWPSTFYELLPLVPLLTDPASHGGNPADAFDVVIPSLPGYGFSDPCQGRGSANRVPGLWAQLMCEVLGYEWFGAHGGDIGAMVANRLALEHPERLLGIHVTRPADPYVGPGAVPLTEAEQALRRLGPAGTSSRAAMSTSSGPAPRPSRTGWPTPQSGWPPGSWRSGGPGATATARWSAASARTSC
jgi:pimeloyl-ACP methyl ester carboxylesterase